MGKLVYWLLLPLAVAVSACGGKKGIENQSLLARIDSIDAHGLQRMQTSKSETNFKFKGKEYHSFVSRTPDESLPHVTNEMGDTYVDNKIVLRLTRGNETVLNKTFTKNDFSSVVDAKFLSKSILEGLVYDKTTSQGIVYAASVCYPQTDLYMPLSITITADGKMSIRKVDMLDENLNDEAPN
ncbi:DUF4738 domain-containing protein [Bacteroides caecimuris]|jgi:hypothetical protein|uniref:DUF4738 domain-containing protein n=1 Tax=Bacteroides caecimuris TaxID=1796613 RepID=A0A1C7GXG7_9BACE|nr:DUF4738 domain-containing protein [Bacteroides caecimuris]ANU56969.1 DUF4738 domain-containing protein [Bacteroides caecimuris]OXE66640.1 DUF4738 domain-containing protein [Bacteroides caecimuris]QQR18170.1 DUF4738 domain-containing protein [Bacteroides caecimuris]UQA31183.1 DUF4738 domain-containing protein [Bacteroides caecimuris]